MFMKPETGNQTRLEKSFREEKDNTMLLLKLYKLVLEKYSDIINEMEKRTVGEIKALVNKDDLTIQSILEDYRKKGYDFDPGYLNTAKQVFHFVSKEISFVETEISVNFWLSPKEVFASRIGDDEDLAVFLCSLLYGLGDENAEVVIAELENLKTHAFVLTQFKENFFILDPCQKHSFEKFSGTMEECLAKYSFQGAKIKKFLYKFNRQKYEQFL